MSPQYVDTKAVQDALRAAALVRRGDGCVPSERVFALSAAVQRQYWVRIETPADRKDFTYNAGQWPGERI